MVFLLWPATFRIGFVFNICLQVFDVDPSVGSCLPVANSSAASFSVEDNELFLKYL